jgi:serine/threonine protein kinase
MPEQHSPLVEDNGEPSTLRLRQRLAPPRAAEPGQDDLPPAQHTLASRPGRRHDPATLSAPKFGGCGATGRVEVPDDIAGYEVLAELGRGGMGVVYKARHRTLQRLAAIKMILAARFAGPEQVLRFRLEGETAASLQHPNIVGVFEVGTHRGQPYMVLEYVEGGSLAQRLRQGRLPAAEAARLVVVLARAVQVAHNHGIIHRDLKPSNVLLSTAACGFAFAASERNSHPELGAVNAKPQAGQAVVGAVPKIADFGLAKHLDRASDLTETGRVLGTPEYMAPEQAAGRAGAVGPHSDVYSLGAILYECLVGQPPFHSSGQDAIETVLQIMSREAVPPSRLVPAVPRDLETICLKCLEKEPKRRYGSALELAEDLRHFQDGLPIQARPVGTAERAWKWARRRPVVAALVAGLVLVSVLGFAGVTGALFYALEGWQQARGERRVAEEERELARKEREIAVAARTREAAERGRAEQARPG